MYGAGFYKKVWNRLERFRLEKRSLWTSVQVLRSGFRQSSGFGRTHLQNSLKIKQNFEKGKARKIFLKMSQEQKNQA